MFALTSSAFADRGTIPVRHTCDGDDRSPPLAWTAPPVGTRSLALIVDDPDAPDPARPKRVWVHWIRYNLPPTAGELAEGAGNDAPLPPSRDLVTDSGHAGYGGPCPPVGRHRYFFRLHALDIVLPDLGPRARRPELQAAMTGHVLASAELMATYQRVG